MDGLDIDNEEWIFYFIHYVGGPSWHCQWPVALSSPVEFYDDASKTNNSEESSGRRGNC